MQYIYELGREKVDSGITVTLPKYILIFKLIAMNTKNISESNFKSLIPIALQNHESGQLEEATNYYQQILKLKPDYAEVHYNLGNALKQQGNLEAAAESYQQALKLKPDYAEAHSNLGNVLKQQGKLNAAICSYEQALKNLPNCAVTYYNLGDALTKRGKLSAAVESYQQALKLKPDYAEVYCNLGNALKKQGKLEAAVESYQNALNIQPNMVEAYCNLGNALKQQGKLEAAAESYQNALKIQPDLARAKLFICINQLPIIYASFAEIELRRNNYQRYLQDLAQNYKQANPQELEKAADAVGAWQPFYLAYQGLNDRNLQQIYGDMIVHLMSNCYPQWSQDINLRELQPNEKVRIGFVSRFFYRHSNWKIPIKGWVENLDRSEFELFAYHTNSNRDRNTTRAAKEFDKFTQGLRPLEEWCELIQKDKLDILIFPEFGMDPMTVQLGCLRLAPIQLTSWGHPNTSGLSTIDYYLSSDLMEPENAQEHYTEKLVRLPNLSIYYTPLTIETKAISKKDIDIAENEIMFWCCQSLFKYLPQHDDVFPRIAEELAKCKFVFIEAPQGKWEEAITCYQKALKLQHNCIEADVNLGNALHAQGKLSPGKQAHYAELNHKLGLSRQKAGDLTTAEVYFQKALELNPNYGEVRTSLEEIYASQQKLKEAEAADRQGVKKDLKIEGR